VRVSRLLAGLALALAAACGKGEDGGRRVRLAIWSDYMPADVLDDFEREAGVRVEIPARYGSNEELLAKLEGGRSGFDLAVPSDTMLPTLVSRGLIERLDPAALPNRRHLDPAFDRRPTDPDGVWSVPYTWGTIGIAWRSDRVAGEVDSWEVFASDRAAGNALLLEEARDVVGAALLAAGRDPNATGDADLAAAAAVLARWKPHVKGFSSQAKDALLSGEAWLCQAYNGDVAQAMRERKDLRFTVPKEGGMLWTDLFVVPKGAPHRRDAHLFLDYVMRPAVAAKVSAGIRYALCNRDAAPLLPEDFRSDPVVHAPDDVRARCRPQRDLGAALPKVVDVLSRLRAGD
jgi:spermidine/putrescine-binding protein